ncbi:MAG TPA: VWA domain-containing protein [Pyrinomonadaceae bacterium]|jgi:Ca-activated chloride channel family protein
MRPVTPRAARRRFARRSRFPRSLARSARLRWLALCVSAALLLSSCTRQSARQDAHTGVPNQPPVATQPTTTSNSPQPAANPAAAKVERQGEFTYGLRDEESERARRAEQYERGDTEAYNRIEENPFIDVARAPLSTFSIDVDTASYSNTRRFLTEGRLPPRDAVRVEELINYFSYDYPQPVGGAPFSVTTEVAQCPWDSTHRLVLVGLQGRQLDRGQLPPANLVFLLDVSGSMNEPNKLPLVKTALAALAEQLTARDRVAIVVYAGNSGLVLDSTAGDRKGEILAALDRLEAGGSTNGGAGIQLAYRVAADNFIQGGINRVVLATDGDFNVGVTNAGELTRLVEEKRQTGVFLSVLGFGTGNYKDATMEQLADKGNGNYAYIDTAAEARKVLGQQVGGTLATIAKDVKLQLEFNPARAAAYRLIGYENRLLRDEDFNDDTKDAGEIGAGHSVTALYEVVPAGQSWARPGVDPLKYQTPPRPSARADSDELLTIKIRYKEPAADESKLLSAGAADRAADWQKTSDNFRFAASVAAFGLLLRDSRYKGAATYDNVAAVARGAAAQDPHGYRAEFVSLVETAQRLAHQSARN